MYKLPMIKLIMTIATFVLTWMLYVYIQKLNKSGCAKKCGVSDHEINMYRYILYYNFSATVLLLFFNVYSIYNVSQSGGSFGFTWFSVFFSVFMIMVFLVSVYVHYIQISTFRKLVKPECKCANKNLVTKIIYIMHILSLIYLVLLWLLIGSLTLYRYISA